MPKLSTEKLTEFFTHKVLSNLKAKELITDTAIAQVLSQSHTGFSALGSPKSQTKAAGWGSQSSLATEREDSS